MDCNKPPRAIRAERLLGAVLSLLAVSPTWGQPGDVPAYISSLADYEVARLDGTLAPSNGKISMASVTPSEWLNNDPSSLGLPGVIVAWSGGAKATGVSSLFVHGGGHNDSANNGLYVYDFAGTDRPGGWRNPLTISSVANVTVTQATYSDGYPSAVHTYDGMLYAKHNNALYRFNGSLYGAGNLTSASFKFDLATKTWTRLPNYPGTGGGAVTLYDPVTGNIFVTNVLDTAGYFFRTSNQTWSSQKSFGGNGLSEVAAAWDPGRNRGIILGGSKNHLLSLNFGTETASLTSITPGGATEVLTRGMSAVYDPGRDSYWLFGGPSGASGWTALYELSAGGPPWSIVRHPLTGPQITRMSGMIGSYGRYVLMDEWRAIGVVAAEDSPAFLIKLPTGQVARPNAPSQVTAN